MTWLLTLSCDGTRPSPAGPQPCRGALHCHTFHLGEAQLEAAHAGWRLTPGRPVLCPSSDHLEDQ